MKRLSQIIIILLAHWPIMAQTSTTADTTVIHQLLNKANNAIDEAQFEEADALAYQALALSEKLKLINWQAKSWRTLGFSAESNRQWESSYSHYLKSLDLWQSLTDSLQMGRICQDIAIMKDGEGDYSNQRKFTERAFNIFKALKDTMRMGDMAINLGNFFKNIGNYDQAKSYFRLAIDLFGQRKKYVLDVAIAQYGLGDTYYKENSLDSASYFIEPIIPIFLDSAAFSRAALAHNVLGAIYQAQAQFPKAKEQYKKSVNQAKIENDSLLQFDAYCNLCRLEIYKSNHQSAKAYYIQAENLLKAIGGGGIDRKELDELKASLEASKQKRASWLILTASLFFISFLGVRFYFLKQRQKQRQATHEFILREKELRHENEIIELYNKSHKDITQAREKGRGIERRKLKKLVHNNIGSQLTATKWSLESCIAALKAKELSVQDLERIITMTTDAYKNSRNIERLLEKEQLNWLQEISSFYEALSKFNNSKTKIKFHAHGLDHGLSPKKGKLIYEIIQIATANTLLHAQADQLTCQLNQLEGELIILIEDDGKGFDPKAKTEGNGIKNLKDLVERLDGQSQVDSSLGKGTNITITIPTP